MVVKCRMHHLMSQHPAQRCRVQRIDELGVVIERHTIGRHRRNRSALPSLQNETEASRRMGGLAAARCAPSGCEAPLASDVSCGRGRLHVRRHMGKMLSTVGSSPPRARSLPHDPATHHPFCATMFGGVCRRSDTQEVVLLEVVRGVIAQPLPDLVRKAVQLGISVDVRRGSISTRSTTLVTSVAWKRVSGSFRRSTIMGDHFP